MNLDGHEIIPSYLSQDRLGLMNHRCCLSYCSIAVIRYMAKATDKRTSLLEPTVSGSDSKTIMVENMAKGRQALEK